MRAHVAKSKQTPRLNIAEFYRYEMLSNFNGRNDNSTEAGPLAPIGPQIELGAMKLRHESLSLLSEKDDQSPEKTS